ncbi:MAG: hypothetical protein ABI723_13510 [Bacteroidia bacterium]
MKQGLNLYFLSAVSIFSYCEAQTKEQNIPEIHNKLTKEYSYLPLSSCFINLPNDYKYKDQYWFRNDTLRGSIGCNLDLGRESSFSTLLSHYDNNYRDCFHAAKEYFTINNLNAVLFTCQDTDGGYMNLIIGDSTFATSFVANNSSLDGMKELRTALLSIYPDANFKKTNPTEYWGNTKLKSFPGKEGQISDFCCETNYTFINDSNSHLIGGVQYFNMYESFDTVINSEVSYWEANNYGTMLLNKKISINKKFKMFEYDKVYTYKDGKQEFSYHALLTKNFKLLYINGGDRNLEGIKSENYPDIKKKFQNAIEKIVID